MLLSPLARLKNHSIFVTLRPCIICLRHIVTKRISQVYYLEGLSDPYAQPIEVAYQRLAKEGGVVLLAMPYGLVDLSP